MLLDLPNRFANPIEEPEIPDPDGEKQWRFVADPLLDCSYYFTLLRAKNADSTDGRIILATEFLLGAIHPHDKPAFEERINEAGDPLGGIWRTQAATALLTHYIMGGETIEQRRRSLLGEPASDDDEGEVVDLTSGAVAEVPLSSD